ncbi:MAG: FixH family protein [Fimbriimonadaceae bacterium]
MRPKIFFAFALAFVGLGGRSLAQQAVKVSPYLAILETDGRATATGKPSVLDFLIEDSTSKKPLSGLQIDATITMTAMEGMAIEAPTVTSSSQPGHYNIRVTFPQEGRYSVVLTIARTAAKSAKLMFDVTPGAPMQAMPGMKSMPAVAGAQGMSGMPGMDDETMKASLGSWPANREGSGTSWQPDSSPVFMKVLHSLGGFEFGTMGTLQAGYVNAGGTRGGKSLFSTSMVMFMGRKDLGGGTLGLHFMTSLDPVLNGARGVPNLFQNGFVVNGALVGDRKDPHNVFSELAVSYGHSLSEEWSGFIYGGPVGEPALGNVMYLHRPSGLEIPEAPISHDWFDGTHISFGVVTLGAVYRGEWKLEGSAFNGHDPVELHGIGAIELNSTSGRLSYNPRRDWSFSGSYGYMNSDVNEHRLTLSAAYSHDLSGGDNFSATAYLGQNIVTGASASNAWLAEATFYHAKEGIFTRFERVDKSELANVPPGNYTVDKLLFGDVHSFYSRDHLDYGIGAYGGIYSYPSALNAFYGKRPFTFGVFLRIRPTKM